MSTPFQERIYGNFEIHDLPDLASASDEKDETVPVIVHEVDPSSIAPQEIDGDRPGAAFNSAVHAYFLTECARRNASKRDPRSAS